MNFERSIAVGDTAFITAYVYDAGTSSVKVRLITEREDLRTREREQTTESYFVYVAIDDDSSPTTVPDLTVTTEEGERLRRAALESEAGTADGSRCWSIWNGCRGFRPRTRAVPIAVRMGTLERVSIRIRSGEPNPTTRCRPNQFADRAL